MGLEIYDITFKSGEPKLAPTADILYEYKNAVRATPNGQPTYSIMKRYITRYINKLNLEYHNDPEWFHNLCKNPTLVLACYCGADTFCHRRLLIRCIRKVCEKHNIPFIYKGEIRKCNQSKKS